MPSLLEKIEKAHSFCKFVKEERDRRNIITSFNRSLETLTKNLSKYCFLKIVLEEFSSPHLKNDMLIQKVNTFHANVKNILADAHKFKEDSDDCQETLNQLNEEISRSTGGLLIEVTKKLEKLDSLLIDKKKMLSNKVMEKVLDINLETIDNAEKLLREFQLRIKRDIFFDDIVWANSEMPKLRKLIDSIGEKISIKALIEKMKLTAEEAEVISRLVSGESVPLIKLNQSLLGKIKEIFGDMAKITITS